MDHQLIDEQGIAESYVTGRLPQEEVALFEEHLLECRECRERVAWVEDLEGSFRAMGTAEAARAVEIGLLAWLARRSRAAQWALAAALFLLAVVVPGLLLVERQELRQELASARALAVPPPRLSPRPSPPVQERPDDVAERDRLAAERGQLGEELVAERRKRQELSDRLAQITRPQVNTAIFSLGLVRGEDEETNQVLLGPAPAWIVLALELPQVRHETYRATLADARGRTVWRGEGLLPTGNDELVISLYSDFLEPGAYRLALEGLPPRDGSRIEIPFRVERVSG